MALIYDQYNADTRQKWRQVGEETSEMEGMFLPNATQLAVRRSSPRIF